MIEVALVSSLLALNYFTLFLSFTIVDFKKVNVCWENYLTFYAFDICFDLSTGGMQDLTRSNAGNFRYSVRRNLSKPSITQVIHSRNTNKFV